MGNSTTKGWAVVTGASSGIGTVFSRELAGRGHPVLLVARRRERLDALAKEIGDAGGRAEALVADLGTPEGVRAVVARATELDIDYLVNNAGFGESSHYLESSVERELACIRLNVEAVVELTHRLLPGMVARKRGTILNIASVIAFQPVPYFATYAATKAFVLSYTESVAYELRGSGVRVVAVCPGPVTTEFEAISGNSKFQRSVPSLTPEAVVSAALRAGERGKIVAVVGFVNRLLSVVNQLLPRAVVRRNMAGFAKPEKPPAALPATASP